MADPHTTDVYADLLSAALVGTDRRPARTSGVPGPLGAALAAVPTADPATALLDAAALTTVYRRAGTRPATGVALPDPAPVETRAEVPSLAGRRLDMLLDGETVELVVEWLELAEAHGRRVPHGLLPRLLDRARHDTGMRAPMLAVGGARMRWLAAQNRDWHYLSVVGGAAEVVDGADWDFGDAGRRLDHLHALRASDPAAAREKLAADWAGEEPRQRAALLGALAVGLSGADEEFLESALDDRRKEVRDAAAAVLVQLPGSAYSRRMGERMAACVSYEGRKLRITPPGTPDAAARRDGLRAGTDIQLLEQILDATPLAAFRALAASLTNLLDATTGDDRWRVASALVHAAERESNVDAARELLSWRRISGYSGLSETLLRVLPDGERIGIIAGWLGRRSIDGDDAYQMVAACPRPWSPELGRAALDAVRKHARRLGYRLHRWAVLLGERLPVELLPDAEKLAETDDTTYGMGRLGELAALRQQMHKEFS